jgi:hypothetical protein
MGTYQLQYFQNLTTCLLHLLQDAMYFENDTTLFKNAVLLRQNVQKMPHLCPNKLGTTPRGSWGVPVPSKQPFKDAGTTVREIL